MVGKWRRRFAQTGIEGLTDEYRRVDRVLQVGERVHRSRRSRPIIAGSGRIWAVCDRMKKDLAIRVLDMALRETVSEASKSDDSVGFIDLADVRF